jgi:hypothetical protein
MYLTMIPPSSQIYGQGQRLKNKAAKANDNAVDQGGQRERSSHANNFPMIRISSQIMVQESRPRRAAGTAAPQIIKLFPRELAKLFSDGL